MHTVILAAVLAPFGAWTLPLIVNEFWFARRQK